MQNSTLDNTIKLDWKPEVVIVCQGQMKYAGHTCKHVFFGPESYSTWNTWYDFQSKTKQKERILKSCFCTTQGQRGAWWPKASHVKRTVYTDQQAWKESEICFFGSYLSYRVLSQTSLSLISLWDWQYKSQLSITHPELCERLLLPQKLKYQFLLYWHKIGIYAVR